MTLDVDATDAPLKILHATMTMAAKPGPLTLFYPKWIPGEHMPSGPIANLTGLHVFADGKELEWRRDLVEMNAFAIAVPAGAKTLTAKYDYVVPTSGGAFGSTASTNAKIAVINWYTVGLYPMGENPDLIQVTRDAESAGRAGSTAARSTSTRVDGDDDPLQADVALDAERQPGAARRALPEHHAVARGLRARRARPRRRRRQRVGAAVSAGADRGLQEDRPRGASRLRRRRPLPQVPLAADAQRQPRDRSASSTTSAPTIASRRTRSWTTTRRSAAACCCRTNSSTRGTARRGGRPGSSPAATRSR